MKPISSMIAAPAAALFTFGFFVMTAPAVYADNYCITNGAHAAHGCGYPNMEVCRAASAGIGGTCSSAPVAQLPGNALAYAPKHGRSQSQLHPARKPAVNE